MRPSSVFSLVAGILVAGSGSACSSSSPASKVSSSGTPGDGAEAGVPQDGASQPAPEGGTSEGGSAGPSAQSTLSRNLMPDASASDQTTLAADNTAFAFDVYHALAAGDATDNLFFSPYSISSALAMAYAGAAGQTAAEMATALHFDNLPPGNLHAAFDAIDLALASRAAPQLGVPGPQLHVANALWGQQSLSFEQPFLDILAVDYGSGVRLADFIDAPDPSRVTINDWVSSETGGGIPALLPAGSITYMTRVVLVNAIDFVADWQIPFNATQTMGGTFTRADGSAVSVDLMRNLAQNGFVYSETAAYQAVSLPYTGDLLQMTIVLPAPGQYAAVEASLGSAAYADFTAPASPQAIMLSVPKFNIPGATFSLKAVLSGLGMPDAFGTSADFSAMTSSEPLHLSDVLHQAFIAIDEQGTVAAAATGVIAVDAAAIFHPPVMTIDRPFFFFIRDLSTKTILFFGRVMDPG